MSNATTQRPFGQQGLTTFQLTEISSGVFAETVATVAAGGPPSNPSGNSFVSSAAITRPANTTAYTANDVVGGVLEFTNSAQAAGYVWIENIRLRYDVSAIPSGMGLFRLHLYSVTPPSAYADNAAWDLPSGDRASYRGFIDFPSIANLGATLYTENTFVGPKVVQLGASQTSLWGYLVTLGGYTPAANSETANVTIAGLSGI